MTAESFGNRLRTIRKARGMTQEQLEARSGIKQSRISALEVGRHHWETLGSGTLLALCNALECNPIWLTTGIGGEDEGQIDTRLSRLIQAADGLTDSGIEALIATAHALKTR